MPKNTKAGGATHAGVDPPAADVAAEPEPELEADAEAPIAPASSAPKAEWVAYAVAVAGLTTGEAEAYSIAELKTLTG